MSKGANSRRVCIVAPDASTLDRPDSFEAFCAAQYQRCYHGLSKAMGRMQARRRQRIEDASENVEMILKH